ncbi:profilin [Gilbertella persicaria]|uniref:profilin n=1 Tax=Gilbertella persicaria TaxID=101096 RepID=UPI00221E4C78|nr:profilin [Gilbertella persicaria]KAI8059944.1 profilin [Gilbertella persicaria]
MSWQAYVDSNLLGTGQVSQAAIYGLNGGEWAKSAGFQLSSNEVKEITDAFSNSEGVLASGVHVNGVKYLTIRAEENLIYAKKGAEGICIAKTNQAFLVGTYKEGIQPGNCNKVVEGLADYLKSVGYVCTFKIQCTKETNASFIVKYPLSLVK